MPSYELSRLSRLKKEVLIEFAEEDRRHIWKRIQRFNRLIPLLHSFFQDFKILKSCVDCLHRLFYRDSSRTTGYHNQKSLIQVSEIQFRASSNIISNTTYR
ncbi:hypothetical protein N7507_005022 [Penicillium longicatenatum]|nr:hypothetical protein N7507_005022 [Penicillium longicatenatum]